MPGSFNHATWNFFDGSLSTRYRLSKEVADRLRALAELAPRYFAAQVQRVVATSPYSHQEKGSGVHSVLRNGFEQRTFANTVLPLGASPVPLSDVGQTQRTSRRRTRHGSDTLGWIMSSHACGGRALDLLIFASQSHAILATFGEESHRVQCVDDITGKELP